jgi:predicted RNA binding protein YcfA (HicA-like mRNA interferase family)
MKSVTGKRMAKLAEKRGWTLLRIHGSHHIFGKPTRFERPSIPVHSNKTLKIGLPRSLMRIIGVGAEDLWDPDLPMLQHRAISLSEIYVS